MGILDMLGVGSGSAPSAHEGDTDTVKRIVSELEALEPRQARFLAAFAYVLSRVANADSTICVHEREAMREIVQQLGHLPEAQALLVVEIAKSQARLLGGTENYLVTREFQDVATAAQRLELLDCLFAVAAADDEVSHEEELSLGQIGMELGLTSPEVAAVRSTYLDRLATLREK